MSLQSQMCRIGSVPCWNNLSYVYKMNFAPKQFWRSCWLCNNYWICHSNCSYFIFHHSAPLLCTHVVKEGEKKKAVVKMMTVILWAGWICLAAILPHEWQIFLSSPFLFLLPEFYRAPLGEIEKLLCAIAGHWSTKPRCLLSVRTPSWLAHLLCLEFHRYTYYWWASLKIHRRRNRFI